MRKAYCLFMLAGMIALTACSSVPPIPVQPSQTIPVLPAPSLPTVTQMVIPTQPAIPTALPPTSLPAGAPSQAAGSPTAQVPGTTTKIDINPQVYLDDRSTAASVIASLYNAINRKEYARAYSYWQPEGAIKNTPFSSFQAGYQSTQSVQLEVGQPLGDAGAGNFYYTLPVGLISTQTDGSQKKFVGCYILHLTDPGVQGTLPFESLSIQKGTAAALQTGGNLEAQVASACSGPDFNLGHAFPAQEAFAPDDISASRYLDDRSNAVQVLRSYYNAVNRSEYLRAYSYWEPAAAKAYLVKLDQFSQGYAETQSVKLAVGNNKSSAGAGQVYYTVPVTLTAKTRSGATQTFVGCYNLHLANPQIQAVPPFQPVGISTAKIKQVANNTDTTALMASACP